MGTPKLLWGGTPQYPPHNSHGMPACWSAAAGGRRTQLFFTGVCVSIHRSRYTGRHMKAAFLKRPERAT